MKRILIGIAGTVLIAVQAFCSEGAVVETKVTQGFPAKYTLSWTASTNGVVVAVPTTFYVRGEIQRAVLSGTSTGATYSLTLKDTTGVDVLAGLGATVATNAVTSFVPGIRVTDGTTTNMRPYVVNDILTLDVTVAGSNKTGAVYLYVK